MQTDVYSTERAGFAERLARLTGGSTWREPMEGYGSRHDWQPEAHRLAQALAYARAGGNDIGPDLVCAIVLQWPGKPHRVVTELAAALLAQTGRVGERCADHLPMIARACYLHVVTGEELTEEIDGVDPRDWLLLTSIGTGSLWQAVEQTIRRAERAYRAAA